jgi:hypothetical protein
MVERFPNMLGNPKEQALEKGWDITFYYHIFNTKLKHPTFCKMCKEIKDIIE